MVLMSSERTMSSLEWVPCPLCGRADPQSTSYGQEPFRVVRCAGCRLWFLSPRLTKQASEALYRREDYFLGGPAGYADYARQEQGLRKTFRRLLHDLEDLGATGGSLLEVGSGLGYFLDEARHCFAQRSGIELSPKAATAAAALAGAPVYHDLDHVEGQSSFNCIVALHVIEHIHEPVAFLRRLKTLLAPGGTIVLAAPHMGSFWRHLMGRYWPSFKYPEHLTFFDHATLRRLLLECGFADLVRLRYLHDFSVRDILSKIHLPAPSFLQRIVVPLPATTICFAARRPIGEQS